MLRHLLPVLKTSAGSQTARTAIHTSVAQSVTSTLQQAQSVTSNLQQAQSVKSTLQQAQSVTSNLQQAQSVKSTLQQHDSSRSKPRGRNPQCSRDLQSDTPSSPAVAAREGDKTLFTFDVTSLQSVVSNSEVSVQNPDKVGDVTEHSFDDIPGPRGVYTWPLIGILLHFKPFTRYTLRNIHELYMSLFERYGSLVRIKFGQWMVLVEDPDDISAIYQNEGRYPRRPTLELLQVYSERNNVSLGVASREDEDWMKMRRPMNQKMLKSDSALKFLQIQNEVADDLVRRFKEIQFSPAEIREEFFKYAIESVSSLAFNKRMGYLDNDLDRYPQKKASLANLQLLFELFNEALHTGTGLYKYFRTPFYKKYEKVSNDILNLTNSILNQCLQELELKDKLGQVNGPDQTFLQTMLNSDDVTLDDVKTVIIDLFVAGSDSTAKNLQLVLYTLAKNPDKQRHLYEEIVSHIGTSGPLTEGALNKMQYLKACVKESFRFYNPISSICRFLPNEIRLRGYRIPKDTMVVMCNHRIVKSQKYFDNPEEFVPERWLRDKDGRRFETIHPMASLPFGFGPRSCVGRRFAEQEIYLALTKIIQTFELGLERGHEEVDIHYTVFITTKDPIHFVFKKR